MAIEDSRLHPLQAQGTVFARYVAITAEVEEDFLRRRTEHRAASRRRA